MKVGRYEKGDVAYFKDWGRIGLFAGGQQFLDNIIYALMICRMVNAVSESGNYWVCNNFIWGWLLIPITCLVEIIRKDAGENGYNLKQITYYSITVFTLILWFAYIDENQVSVKRGSLSNVYYEKDYSLTIKDKTHFIELANKFPPLIHVDLLYKLNICVFDEKVYEDILSEKNWPRKYLDFKDIGV